MKHLLLTTIAAVVLVGCGGSQQSVPQAETKPAEPVAEAAKPEPTTVKPEHPQSNRALIQAVDSGNNEAVKQHLADGADVNAKGERGSTPLHFAAWLGHKEIIEIVELLIANGADVNAMDENGGTPLDGAIIALDVNAGRYGWQKPETAELLRKHGGKMGDWLNADKSIHKAASAGHIEAVKQHLAAGADVNAKEEDGHTPLHLAAAWGQKEIAEVLIANGADVNAKDDDETPLDWAIRKDSTEIGDLLRKHGGKTGAELKAEGK